MLSKGNFIKQNKYKMITINQNKRRVLFVTHGTSLYGSERCMIDLIKNLDREKYKVFAIIKSKGHLKDELDVLGVNVLIFPLKQWIACPQFFSRWHFREVFFDMPRRVKFIADVIDREKIDLVYSNSMIVIDGAVAAKIKGIPNITHIHEMVERDPYLKPYLPIFIVHGIVKFLSKRVIVVSNAVKKSLKSKIGFLSNRKIKVVYNGVDLSRFDSENPSINNYDLRSEYNVSADEKIVATVGRLYESKGQRDFIEAASIISKVFKNVRFLIIGTGGKDVIGALKNKIKEVNLEDKFIFMNFRSDIVSIYTAIDVYVLASWLDSFPLTVLEAMAMGKPVVATYSGGAEESVVGEQTGFLVPIKSPQKMAEAVIKLLTDDRLARRMGVAGQERVNKFFNGDKYADEIIQVIEDVLENNKDQHSFRESLN